MLEPIDEINEAVLNMLKMLTGGGGEPITKSPHALLKIMKGLTTDHTHKGYKDVTMYAFQIAIQTMLENCYFALKLLENDPNINESFPKKLLEDEHLKYLLKILGFKRADRTEIIETLNQKSDNEKIEFLKNIINSNNIDKKDQKTRLEMMVTGLLCYFPFSEPNDGHRLNIPVKDQKGNYYLEETQVERINMSPDKKNPYYALQLSPVKPTNENAYVQNHVIFMGTNPLPTSSGPSITIYADTVPGKSIGEIFVDASEELFKKMLTAKFKENLYTLIKDHLDDFKNETGEINYQKLWLAARVKCVGQSLGGSLSLQMLAKYPHMVEVSTFESPFLLKNYKRKIEENLLNAQKEYFKIIEDLNLENSGIDIEDLKRAVPKNNFGQLEAILSKNNVAIAQSADLAIQYGTESPPLYLLYVTRKAGKNIYEKIRNNIFDLGMGLSLLSHAMVLASDQNKEIKRLDNLYDVFDKRSRALFTFLLDKEIWPSINSPTKLYIQIKHFFLNKIYDPKMNPAKNPKYIEINKLKTSNELRGKWELIKTALEKLEKNPEHWQAGAHLNEKIEDFFRFKERADALKISTDYIGLDSLTLREKYNDNETIKPFLEALNRPTQKTRSHAFTPGFPKEAPKKNKTLPDDNASPSNNKHPHR